MASLNDFTSWIKSAPATGTELNKSESKLLAERERVANVGAHIDDLVAKGVNGVRKSAADAKAHLIRHHLNAESLAATHVDSIESDAIVFDLLSLTPGKPSPANTGDPKQTAAIFPQGTTPHAGMLTYLLLPQMEKAVEQLIRENLTEACKGGMRLSERRKRLDDIDAKLAAIRARRADLVASLKEAARHVEGAPEAIEKGPSAADIAEAYASGSVIEVGAQ
jgi:hypothetical protein